MTDTQQPEEMLDPDLTAGVDAEIDATSSRRATLEILLVSLGGLTVSLSQSVFVPLLGILPAELQATTTEVEWLLTSTLLVSAVAVPIMGRLGDMYGKRLLLLISVALGTIGSLICAMSYSIVPMIVGRSFQGAGIAAIPLAISLLATLLPPERRAGGIAMVSATMGIGGALGMPLAGLIAGHTDYHVIFWLTTVVCVIILIAMYVVIPESPYRSGGRFDLRGALLLSSALIALLLPLAEAANWGWASPRTWGLLLVSLLLFVIFGRVQSRTHEPLVDLRTTRRKPILMAHIASVLYGVAMFASMIATAAFVQAPESAGYGFGASVVVGGLCMLPGGLLMLPGAAVAGRLINKYGGTAGLATGGIVMTIGWTARLFFNDNYIQVIAGSSMISLGIAFGTASLPSIINAHVPASEIAAANGLNSLMRSVGNALTSAVAGTLMATFVIHMGNYELPSLTAYRIIFAICGAAAACIVVLAFLMPKAPAQGH